jgi:acyl-CoA thioester hydrolase
METVFYQGQVLWSQIDANQHLRHSAYADFGAQARLCMLEQAGMTTQTLLQLKIGPILFREDLLYHREVRMDEHIRVTCELLRSRPDGSRWTIRHGIYRSDDVKAATITAEGAWIDMQKRRITALPEQLGRLFRQVPRAADYTEDIPQDT